MAIVRRVLGRAVGPDDDLFVAGLDSLGAVDLWLTLEREMGQRLPASLLLAAPTVAQLTASLAEAPGAERPALYPLATGGMSTPLVLVPSHSGHHFPYTVLAHHLSGTRPVFASSVSPLAAADGDEPFESLARRHVALLTSARFDGPYLLGGFCFGGALAYEMARQLAELGRGPVGLMLLGMSPYDLPGLVPPGAEERWMRSMTPVGKLGRAIRFAVGAMIDDAGRRHAIGQLHGRRRTLQELASREGRARRRSRLRRSASIPRATGRYLGPAVSVPVTLILPSWSLTTYWGDPRTLWDGIGSSVDIHMVPGVERMMLREPVVAAVAQAMSVDPGSGRAGPAT